MSMLIHLLICLCLWPIVSGHNPLSGEEIEGILNTAERKELSASRAKIDEIAHIQGDSAIYLRISKLLTF